jgi:restriction endonuclease S subunit
MLLEQVSKSRTGQTFKKSIQPNPDGDLSVILPRDISNGQLITTPVIINSDSVSSVEKHRLKPGEILIVNKGFKFGTFLYNQSPVNAIATSSFFVIATDHQKLLPGFLLWYLNQPPAREYFASNAFGSTIPSITLHVLTNLNIPDISLSKQRYVVDLLVEVEREQRLLKELTTKREGFFNSHIWECIKKETVYDT